MKQCLFESVQFKFAHVSEERLGSLAAFQLTVLQLLELRFLNVSFYLLNFGPQIASVRSNDMFDPSPQVL